VDLNPQEPEVLPLDNQTHGLNLSTPPQYFPYEEIRVENPPEDAYLFDQYLHATFASAEESQPQRWNNFDEGSQQFFDQFLFNGV
jgi:hypothetical protein